MDEDDAASTGFTVFAAFGDPVGLVAEPGEEDALPAPPAVKGFTVAPSVA